jgi:hypothetical protein
MAGKSQFRKAAQVGKFLVPAVIAVFVGRVIYSNWSQIRQAEWDLDPPYLILSAVLCAPWFWARPLGWNLLVNAFGRRVPFSAVFRVVRHSELSRFLPGGIWAMAGRVYLVKKWRVKPSSALAATVVDLVLTTLAALIPALWSLSEAFPNLGRAQQVVFIVFPIVSIAVVHPKLLNLWAGFVFRRAGQDYEEVKIRWHTLLGIWGLYACAWIMLCAGVAMMIRGVLRLGPGGTTFMGSSYAAAWLAGSFAMISPAGMGIREGALGLLLSRWMPTGPAFTVAIVIRLWLILMEVAWVAIGALLPRPEPPVDEDTTPSSET